MDATLVDAVMSKKLVSVAPDATVREAAQLMADRRVGSVVVVEDASPVGILTERDLAGRVVAAGLHPERVRVREVMSSPVLTIEPAIHIDKALVVMREHRVKRLVVVLDGRIRGVVTVTDLAHAQPELARRFRDALGARWED